MEFNIHWRSNEGYGDFITGLCYAHSSVIKYDRNVTINFHWPNKKGSFYSKIDFESIDYKFEKILETLKPIKGLSIEHTYSSIPPWRFINELEEFNPIHGLWYPKDKVETEKGLVVFWSSKHNVKFPGYHKDPLYDHWEKIINNVKSEGFNVVEVTYRTPIKETLELIHKCEFGIGYEGMIHQLFKYAWKPIICASKRVELSRLLCPQAHIISDPELLLNDSINPLLEISKINIEALLIKHKNYLNDKQDPTQHKLYNVPI